MVIVDFSIHVHTVHIYVQMRYATLCIMMESNYILTVLYVGGFRTGTFSLFREVNGIEYLDVLVCQSNPIVQHPACGFFLSWGYFHSYHIPFERSAFVDYTGKFFLFEYHTLVHGFSRYVIGQKVHFHDLGLVLVDRIADGVSAVADGGRFCYHLVGDLLSDVFLNFIPTGYKGNGGTHPLLHETGVCEVLRPMAALYGLDGCRY